MEAIQKIIGKTNGRRSTSQNPAAELRVVRVQPGQPVAFRLSAGSDSPMIYAYQITLRSGRTVTTKSILSPVPLDHLTRLSESAVHERFQALAPVPTGLQDAFSSTVREFYYLAWREALIAAWRNPSGSTSSYTYTVPALDSANNPIELGMFAAPNERLQTLMAEQARLSLLTRRGQLPPNLSAVDQLGFDTIYPALITP